MRRQRRRNKRLGNPPGGGGRGSEATGGRSGGEDKHVFRDMFVCVLAQEPTKIARTKHPGWTEQSRSGCGGCRVDLPSVNVFTNTSVLWIVVSHSPLSCCQMVGSVYMGFSLTFEGLVEILFDARVGYSLALRCRAINLKAIGT